MRNHNCNRAGAHAPLSKCERSTASVVRVFFSSESLEAQWCSDEKDMLSCGVKSRERAERRFKRRPATRACACVLIAGARTYSACDGGRGGSRSRPRSAS
eukprot:994833-Pleurochrysis_carterae.AAC.2